jgi:Tol biopolymer transport system component
MIETKGFYEFGPFRIDPAERLVIREGVVVPLPPKAFDTLLLLVRNSGRILSKEELMKAIWPDTFVEEASLAQSISVLRRALGEAAGERQYIETIPRRGYRFLPQVEDKRVPTLAEHLGSHISNDRREQSRAPRRSPTLYIAGAAAVGLLVGAMASRQSLISETNDANSHILTPLATAPGLEVHPSWAPNGRTIAYAGEVDGAFQIFTKTLGSSMPTQITRLPKDCYFPIWSPDGRRILFTSGAATFGRSTLDLWSVGVIGGIPNLLLENVRQATLSADGKALAFIRGPAGTGFGELWISSPPGAPPEQYSQPPFADRKYLFDSAVNFSPDGSSLGASLVSMAGNTEFWILPFPSGKPFQAHAHFQPVPAMNWSNQFSWMPDGRHIVFAQHLQFFPEAHLWLADIKAGTVRVLTSGIGAEQAPAVSGDGSRIAFVSYQGTYDLVEVPLDGSPMRDYFATTRNEVTPSWSPRAAHLAYVTDRSGMVEIWLKNVQEGWERPIVTQKEFGHDRTFQLLDACFSLDGQRVAYRRVGESGEAIWISTIAGDPPVRLTPASKTAFQRGPTWSPDGNWIAYYSVNNGIYGVVMKARVNGEGEPVVVRSEGYYPRWSPNGDWILSRGSGLFLTSPDRNVDRKISDRTYMLHGWSKDGSLVYGIRGTDNRHLVLESINPDTLQVKLITDFGPVPASMRFGELYGTTAFRGFSMSPGGKSFLTSVFRSTSDIWMLEGFR